MSAANDERPAEARTDEERTNVSKPLVAALLGVALVVVAGAIFGLPAAFLAGAFVTLMLVIGLVWGGLTAIDAEPETPTLEEALHLAVPSRAEEQKRAVLRTLKDLDYELSLGKISREDYEKVSREVREEARRMIALVDETLESKRLAARRLYEEHLAKTAEIPGENP